MACAPTGLANLSPRIRPGQLKSYLIPADLERVINFTPSTVRTLVARSGTTTSVNRPAPGRRQVPLGIHVNINIRPYYAEGSRPSYRDRRADGWRARHVVAPRADRSSRRSPRPQG